MKVLLVFMISYGAVLTCSAAEIVAWKIPLSRFVEKGLEAEGIARLESAPQQSPFFKEGDELWDLNEIPPEARKETDPPLKWAIWNATSGRLVVKAEDESVWQLCFRMGISDLPTQCRLKAEVLEVPADVRPPDKQSKPTLVTSWVVPFGVFDISPVDDPLKFRAKGDAYVSEDKRSVWIEIETSFRFGDKTRITFNSSVSLPDGKSGWVAREFDGKKGMDLRIIASIELEDGSVASEVMLIQKGTTSEPVHVDRKGTKRHRLGAERWMAYQFNSANFLQALFEQESDFEETSLRSEDVRDKLGIVETQAPDSIRKWFDGPVWDIGGKMKEKEVIPANSSAFAGYDPISNRVFLHSDSAEEIEKFEQLFLVLDGEPPKAVVATLSGVGQTRIMMPSCNAGSLELWDDEENLIRRVQVYSEISEENNTVEMYLDYFDQSDSPRKGEFKATVTSKAGEPVEVLGGTSENGDPFSIRLSASPKDSFE